LLDAADPVAVPRGCHALNDVDQALYPLSLDLVRHLIRHGGGLRPLSRRVDEGEGTVVADLLDGRDGLQELAFRLAGEADDEIRGESQVRDRAAKLGREAKVTLSRVGAPHRLENARRAGLERQVGVLADR